MDVRFRWEAAALAAVHRQRTRRVLVLQATVMPVLAALAGLWLAVRAGSPAALWAQAPGPVIGLVLLAGGWPIHMAGLHARHAARIGRAHAGDWHLRLAAGRLLIGHRGVDLHVPLADVRIAASMPRGTILALADREIVVPPESAPRLLASLGVHAGAEGARRSQHAA